MEMVSLVIYYCDSSDGEQLVPHMEVVEEIIPMLQRMRELHAAGKLFITSTSHTRDGVVQGVIDGKLPDGTPYTWKKRRP